MIKFSVILFVLLVTFKLISQNEIDKEVILLLEQIKPKPNSVIKTKNSNYKNLSGGHLQGVQLVVADFYYLTGSSGNFSYLIKTKRDSSELIKLEKAPFKHAGGFQIDSNLMAVGIEDNVSKNKSKVIVYSLDSLKELAVINREGEVKRNTAGCVGICTTDTNICMVVGDWNTEHLDFYIASKVDEKFQLTSTIKTKQFYYWKSYQNINLFYYKENFYLFGLTGSVFGKNIIDLYKINIDFETLQFLTRKKVKNKNAINFRWGGGIHWNGYNFLVLGSNYGGKKVKVGVYE